MKTYRVLIEVRGWIDIGSVQADTREQALERAQDIEHPDSWDPQDLYNSLERTTRGSADVEED